MVITINFASIVVMCILSGILGFVFPIMGGIFAKEKKPKTKSYNISNKELNELVSKYYKDYSKVEFTEFVSDWLNGKVPPEQMTDNGGAMVVEPCKGPDCPCYPTREDHCDCMGADGMCHHMINLNVICGIHECAEHVMNNAELLTEDELMLLTETLMSINEEKYCNDK